MFYGMVGLETVDVSGLNTENVVNMSSMFEGCMSLKHLDLSTFDTSSTISMNSMFRWCENLETLNINNFSFNRVKESVYNYYFMFEGTTYNNKLNIIVNPNIVNFMINNLHIPEGDLTIK